MSRPAGAKILSPKAFVKGKCYPVEQFIQEKCNFENPRTGEKPLKLIACTRRFGMNFIAYMPFEYDNRPQSYVAELNSSIAKKQDVHLVFYGTIQSQIILDILLHGEEVDMEKLEGIALIENVDAESRAEASKRKSTEFNDTPLKRSHSAASSSSTP